MKNIFILVLLSIFTGTALHAQEKELPPPGGEPKDFTLPEKEVVMLDNGLRLVMIPYGSIPKATINVIVKTGNIHEKEDQVWLCDLMGDLMQEGTDSLNAKQIADKMAGMGGNLGVSVSNHNLSLGSSVLYEFAPDAISLIADVLRNPGWPESEVERLKNNIKRNVTVSLSNPQSQARASFFSTLYPDHPYGRVFPSVEMIDSYQVENVKAFYDANVGAQRTTVYVAGKFDKTAVEKAVRDAFQDWKKGPENQYPAATVSAVPSVQVIDRPNAPQSTILYGLPVVDPSHPDYVALDVTNSILGGSFGSRITSNIREDKGYTYSPSSSIDSRYRSAIWAERADVTTEFTGASLQEINNEIIRLQNEPPTEEELDGIKKYESGLFVLQNSTPGGIIGQLNFLDIHGLDESYLKNLVKNINAVTPEQIQEMTQKYIQPDKMTLVVVGDKKQVEEQLKEHKNKLKD
ncbi:pitrilysin family protein [Ascidiimonas aurantiaca]|uniref:M16 family metallopeptidase n=1 Tax=Ascidiimonas aurantiaca TaxID=1685432 RepID=UPI0030EF1B13